MCGILGIASRTHDVFAEIYDGLLMLQEAVRRRIEVSKLRIAVGVRRAFVALPRRLPKFPVKISREPWRQWPPCAAR